MRVFKTRQFTPGTLVDIRLEDPYIENGLIKALLTFMMDSEIHNIGGGSTVGRGMYIAFHTTEDARDIKDFVKEWLEKEDKDDSKNSL